MTFAWPALLFGLVAVPLLGAFYLRMQVRRRRMAAQLGTLGIVRAETVSTPGIRRYLPPSLYLTGLAVAIIATARPQAVVNLPRLAGTVILAFDVSGSMAADDLEPTRIEAAKTAAIDFVERQPSGVRIGIVSFSESGFVVHPPDNDQAAILSTIDRLRPERGTSLAAGIMAALNILYREGDQETARLYSNLTPVPIPKSPGEHDSAVILLLTDGENTAPPGPREAAQIAADRGVRIHTIGVGSPRGVALEVDGFIVHTQLDESTLEDIARITGGRYYRAEDEEDLNAIYREIDPEFLMVSEKTEITALAAAAAILLLLVGAACSLLWFGRVP